MLMTFKTFIQLYLDTVIGINLDTGTWIHSSNYEYSLFIWFKNVEFFVARCIFFNAFSFSQQLGLIIAVRYSHR